MSTAQLWAGVARAIITPPIGIPMAGFAGRGLAAGIHDELTATALVLGSGGYGEQIALVCCDLLFLGTEEIAAIRAAIEQRAGIGPSNVLIASSHNHYGPVTGMVGLASVPGPEVAPYMANLANTVAGIVAAAARTAAPARLHIGLGEAVIGINRRERTPDGRIILGQNPDGPVDPRVAVLRVDRVDGSPLAAVVNYACHGVSLGGQCTDLSADFPAVARRVVETETGATCLFLQGAAGDINPLLIGWDFSHPARLGLPLGAEAVRVFHVAEPVSGGLAIERASLSLPPLLPASVEAAQTDIAMLERQLSTATGGELYWLRSRIDRMREGLAVIRGNEPPATIDTEITALALAEQVGLVTAPGEIFCEIGVGIVERSAFPYTLYSGYTNGSINYVPTRKAYAEGGYEVTHGCQVAPEAGEILAEESIALLAAVRAKLTA